MIDEQLTQEEYNKEFRSYAGRERVVLRKRRIKLKVEQFRIIAQVRCPLPFLPKLLLSCTTITDADTVVIRSDKEDMDRCIWRERRIPVRCAR